MPSEFQQYIMDRVTVDTAGCWRWNLCKDSDGYGEGCFRKRKIRAHKLSYEAFVGPVPDGLMMDHLCRVRDCVNPTHLEPVTPAENARRGDVGAKPKTHCKRGHSFAEHGRKSVRGYSQCRICDRLRRSGRQSAINQLGNR